MPGPTQQHTRCLLVSRLLAADDSTNEREGEATYVGKSCLIISNNAGAT